MSTSAEILPLPAKRHPVRGANEDPAITAIHLAADLGVDVFHDQFSQPCGLITRSNGRREVVDLRGGVFRDWLVGQVWHHHEVALKPSHINAAIAVLASMARDGRQRSLENRFAAHDGDVWLDLGDGAVRVEPRACKLRRE